MSEQVSPESVEVAPAAEAPEPVPTYEANPEAIEPTAEPAASSPAAAAPSGMGTFADDGSYVPRQVTEDDLGGMSMDDAYTATMVEVEDGQIVEGTVVKVADLAAARRGDRPCRGARRGPRGHRPVQRTGRDAAGRSGPVACRAGGRGDADRAPVRDGVDSPGR